MSKILKSPYINITNENILIKNEKVYTKPIYTVENVEQVKVDTDEIENEISQENEIEQEILETARNQADIIIQNAKENSEKILLDAKNQREEIQKNYEEALEKGYKEGLEKAEKDFEEKANEANEVLKNAYDEKEQILQNLEPQIINFIIDTTQNILTNAYKFNEDIIKLLIKKGLGGVKFLENIKICVNSTNYSNLSHNFGENLGLDIAKNNIELIQDDSLEANDCVIETQLGTIDCSIDEQFNSIKEALYYILN